MYSLKKENIFLLTVLLCLGLVIFVYQINVDYFYTEKREWIVLANYGGLIFLVIPHIVYLLFAWRDLKLNKGFWIIQAGYLFMILLVIYVLMYKLINIDSILLNMSPYVYYPLVFGLVACFIVGGFFSYFDKHTSMTMKIMLVIEVIALSLFITSELKSFYPNFDGQIVVYDSNLPFRFEIITHLVFSDLHVFLFIAAMIASIALKYRSLQES